MKAVLGRWWGKKLLKVCNLGIFEILSNLNERHNQRESVITLIMATVY